MANESKWLERLESATSYRDLQAVFSQLASEAHNSPNATDLAQQIDEAIRRIEEERMRDQSQMESSTEEYDSFKQEQSGVIGWLKRKMPFTETRKQELHHREAVNEQHAEILADNFVIARAQMLKELILPSPVRRMGLRIGDWRSKLTQHESILGIREYGNLIGELGREISQAQNFIQLVSREVEAFSEATFSDKEDRSRRDADLLAARGDVKAIRDEVNEKTAIRKSGLKRLGQLVNEELSANDPTYRSLVQRNNAIRGLSEQIVKFTKPFDDYREALKTMCVKLSEFEGLPDKRDKLDVTLRDQRRDSEEAELRRSRASNDAQQPTNVYNAAVREVQQSNTALNASKSIYDAYLTEQNKAEVSSPADFQTSSPVQAEYERLKNLAAQAEENLRRATPAYETAKRLLDQATKEADEVRAKIDATSKAIASVQDEEAKLRKEINSARDSLARTVPLYRNSLQEYAATVRGLAALDSGPKLTGVPNEVLNAQLSPGGVPQSSNWSVPANPMFKSNELTSCQQNSDLADKFEKYLQSDKQSLDREIARIQAVRKEAFGRRCEMLVDGSVANEVSFE